jgi:TolA-binding protein
MAGAPAVMAVARVMEVAPGRVRDPAMVARPAATASRSTRIVRTIQQLRDEIKGLKGATGTTAKERDELAAKLKELEDKDKSEAERLAGDLKSTGEKLTATEQKARNLAIRAAIAETAGDVGISGAASIKAAMRLLDPSALKFDDEGAVTNAEDALKALVKEYPMLAGQAAGGEGKPKSIGGTKEPTDGDQSDAALVAARAKEQRERGRFGGF